MERIGKHLGDYGKIIFFGRRGIVGLLADAFQGTGIFALIQGSGAMVFVGICRVFSTVGEQQYETIGAFWDEISARYGLENLRGLGYNWTETTIEYVIGLKEGTIDGADCVVQLPDTDWVIVSGKTSDLGKIYDEIYRDGALRYEIETFDEDGSCVIMYRR